jgi:hypothetical protein
MIAPLSPLRERDSLTSSVAGTTGCCRRNGQETVLSARSAGHWSLTILPIINAQHPSSILLKGSSPPLALIPRYTPLCMTSPSVSRTPDGPYICGAFRHLSPLTLLRLPASTVLLPTPVLHLRLLAFYFFTKFSGFTPRPPLPPDTNSRYFPTFSSLSHIRPPLLAFVAGVSNVPGDHFPIPHT